MEQQQLEKREKQRAYEQRKREMEEKQRAGALVAVVWNNVLQ